MSAGPAAPILAVVTVESVVIGVLALLYAFVWRRTREPGMPMLALGCALASLWYGASDGIPVTGPLIEGAVQHAWAIVIGLAVVALTVGVVQYLGMPDGPWRWAVLACWGPAAVLIGALALGISVAHFTFHYGVLLAYVGAAGLALRRALQSPGEGHLALGLALLSLPALPFMLLALGVDAIQLRYFAGVSVAVFGMVLLAISLVRRQRALAVEVGRRAATQAKLAEANAGLELRVAERTAHLRELVAGLEGFGRGVSHDLRGPLGGMSQLARMAADGLERGDDALARRALPTIAAQCEASVRMVSAMLDLARLGEVRPARAPVELASLVASAFDEAMLAAPDIPRPTLHCAGLPTVHGDATLLRIAFVNLLGNAIKFSRAAAAPRIEVDARPLRDAVAIEVRDNGIGFSADAAERLFEPFFRAADARYEGHGLGLSIVRRAVEAMGGSVHATPGERGGACIRLVLPAGEAAGAAGSTQGELAASA